MWFHIKAASPKIKKNGIPLVITFWLFAKSREKLDKLLKKKNITEIEWIRDDEIPSFID
jgi:hypothetical protein